ncbi:MAG: glycosyltransferase family 4 protein [Patescibacteria group bacterium]|nr:glycosyltransferase family 4 protein [Patescibacteria group bacterium]
MKSIWLRTWMIRPWYKAIYRRADYIQPISNFLKDRAVKYGFTGRVKLVPNGVDAINFNSNFTLEERNKLRSEIGLKSEDKVLISASRLVKKNGLDILIKSIKDLNVKVIILGTGKQESKLKALAQELGLREKVLFLGHVSHKDLPRYLKIADVFIRPSRSEGLGTAFLEAMSVGLPIIATRVGGIPDFLIERETGLFCELNNPRDLREKIDLILADHKLREKIINQGLNLVHTNYQWDLIASQMKEIFQSI